MSDGPPPVPGGRRSPGEREVARREREERRSSQPEVEGRDWLGEAQQLTAPPGGRTGPRWGRIVALLAAVIAVAGVAWFLVSLFQPFADEGGERVRVVVPRGSSLEQIAELLESEGVVANSTFFQLRARLTGRTDELKPGAFTLRKDMSFAAALDALEQGVPPNLVQVTIPEGLSRREIADTLGDGLRGSYLAASRRSSLLDPRDYGAKGAPSLEGFLFPATYELRRGVPVRRLVERQLTAFKERFATVDMSYARSKNLTDYDVLVIASMVEREAGVPGDRKLISSVIYNRLREDIPLGIDATIRYETGNWKSPLRQSELDARTPYNTRLNQGLPPGPIGNPGIESIKAAARPARTDYLFFVVKPCGDGRHAFAATDAEHQRNVARYEQARDEAGGRSPTNC